MTKRFFSAQQVLGSRPGSVGVGVSGVPGAAWVWRGTYPPSLALSVKSATAARALSATVSGLFPVRCRVRNFGGRYFVRVRGERPALRSVAVWFGGGSPTPSGSSGCRFGLLSSVAVVGSRHGSPWAEQIAHLVADSGVSAVTGCARGVDAVARRVIPADQLTVYRAAAIRDLPPARALAARTRQLIAAAACVIACPGPSGVLGRGTGLAVDCALTLGLPVFVCGPTRPVGAGWVPCVCGPVVGWACYQQQLDLGF